MRPSARNVLDGTVTEIREGPVTTPVTVDIGGGTMLTSTITTDAKDDPGIAAGGRVRVVIKASSILPCTQ